MTVTDKDPGDMKRIFNTYSAVDFVALVEEVTENGDTLSNFSEIQNAFSTWGLTLSRFEDRTVTGMTGITDKLGFKNGNLEFRISKNGTPEVVRWKTDVNNKPFCYTIINWNYDRNNNCFNGTFCDNRFTEEEPTTMMAVLYRAQEELDGFADLVRKMINRSSVSP